MSAKGIKAGDAYVRFTADNQTASGITAAQSQIRGFLQSTAKQTQAVQRVAGTETAQQAAQVRKSLTNQKQLVDHQVQGLLQVLRTKRAAGIQDGEQLALMNQIRTLVADRRHLEEQVNAVTARRAMLLSQEQQASSRLNQIRTESAGMDAYNRQVGLSTATQARFHAELRRGRQVARAATAQYGQMGMAVGALAYGVEDAVAVYGTTGLSGALRASANNLSQFAMIAMGPWAAAAAIALTTGLSLWTMFSKNKDEIEANNKALDRYIERLKTTTDHQRELAKIHGDNSLQSLSNRSQSDREKLEDVNNELQGLTARRSILQAQRQQKIEDAKPYVQAMAPGYVYSPKELQAAAEQWVGTSAELSKLDAQVQSAMDKRDRLEEILGEVESKQKRLSDRSITEANYIAQIQRDEGYLQAEVNRNDRDRRQAQEAAENRKALESQRKEKLGAARQERRRYFEELRREMFAEAKPEAAQLAGIMRERDERIKDIRQNNPRGAAGLEQLANASAVAQLQQLRDTLQQTRQDTERTRLTAVDARSQAGIDAIEKALNPQAEQKNELFQKLDLILTALDAQGDTAEEQLRKEPVVINNEAA